MVLYLYIYILCLYVDLSLLCWDENNLYLLLSLLGRKVEIQKQHLGEMEFPAFAQW